MRPYVMSFIVPLFALACGSSRPKPSEPEPAPTPDPIVVKEEAPAPAPVPGDPKEMDPTIYKSLLENETVRVFEVTFKPGDKIGLHKHPEHTIYVISGGKLKTTSESGEVQELDLQPGMAMFAPAEAHSAENVGTTEIKAVVVEQMKKGTAMPEGGKDPVAVGPTIYKQVLDDPHVRVMEITFVKGAKIAKHAHPDHVVYMLTAGKLQITPDVKGAKAEVFELQQGVAMFLPAQGHSAANKGTEEIKAIVFEIRP